MVLLDLCKKFFQVIKIGITDKLKFWKKDDKKSRLDSKGMPDLNSDNNLGNNSLTDNMTKDPFDDLRDMHNPGLKEDNSQGFNPHSSNDPFSSQPKNPINMNKNNTLNSQTRDKDIEVVSAKLDAIKAMLDNMNQRIIAIEEIAKAEQQQLNKNQQNNNYW